jgi:hypothetical protein
VLSNQLNNLKLHIFYTRNKASGKSFLFDPNYVTFCNIGMIYIYFIIIIIADWILLTVLMLVCDTLWKSPHTHVIYEHVCVWAAVYLLDKFQIFPQSFC